MMNSICSRTLACAPIAVAISTLFIAPQAAFAGNTVSQGGA